MSKLWRIYCTTESDWSTGEQVDEPTVCFNNATHTVNPNSASFDDIEPTFGNAFEYFTKSEIMSTSSSSYVEACSFDSSPLDAGTYRIGWNIYWSGNSWTQSQIDINLDNSSLMEFIGKAVSDEVIERSIFSGQKIVTIDAGIHAVSVLFKTKSWSQISINNVYVEIWKIN